DDKNMSDKALQEAEAKMKGEEARSAAANRSVDFLEAALESRAAGVRKVEVKAERGGQVVEVLAQPGETIEAGQTIARLARFDRLLARVDLPPGEAAGQSIERMLPDVRFVAPGQESHPLHGTRIGISASVNPKTQ